MKKILSLICALLIVIQSFSETQEAPPKDPSAKEPKNTQGFNDADIDYNYFGKPLDTKNGIERQIQELNDLIKKKRDEKNSWPQIQTTIEARINSFNNKKLSIKKQIEDLAKITDPAKLAGKLLDILNSIPGARSAWSEELYLYTDEYNVPSIKSFVFDINSRSENSVSDKTGFFDGLSKELSDIVYKRGDRYNSAPLQLTDADKETINNAKNQLTNYDWETYFGSLVTVYTNAKQDIANKITGCADDIKKLNGLLDNLYKSLEENDKNINVIAITWGLPIFCLTIILLFGISFWYGKFVNAQAVAGQTNNTEGLSKILLEIITVLLLTMTVLILGLSGRITENVLGTLLGGVAGYILNRTKPN